MLIPLLRLRTVKKWTEYIKRIKTRMGKVEEVSAGQVLIHETPATSVECIACGETPTFPTRIPECLHPHILCYLCAMVLYFDYILPIQFPHIYFSLSHFSPNTLSLWKTEAKVDQGFRCLACGRTSDVIIPLAQPSSKIL